MKLLRVVTCLGILSILFSGCQSTQPPVAEAITPTAVTGGSVEVSPSLSLVSTSPIHTLSDSLISFSNPGALRIPYTTGRCGVQYITDPSQLPDYPEFSGYDSDFFKEHALLLVTDTVGSGSTQISIDSIAVNGNTASVTLRRVLPGDVGTADMATWLLWAEVPAGLDLTWETANPGLSESDSSGMHTS